MPLKLTVVDDIPPLAWLVAVGDRPCALLGRGVDVEERDGRVRVTEGVWNADFAGSDILQASQVFGSGFVVGTGAGTGPGTDIVFCAASHTLESLYALTSGRRTLVSNSLSFLVRCGDVVLDPTRPIYRQAHSLMRGVLDYDRLIYEKDGTRIHRYACCNFRPRDGGFEDLAKPPIPAFPTYEAYRSCLLEVLASVRDNASSPARKARYALLASVSSGYDSAAGAALAAAAGCRRAVTIGTGKHGASDSGRPVAEALGLECFERERAVAPSAGEPFPEAAFIAAFEAGDSMFSAFADLLPGSLLVVRHYGDVVWGLGKAPDDHLVRTDMTGMGIQEFRLATDFVTVPVAYIGARRRCDIDRIARSEEMRPYRVGGDYDRPVPRRIVEEGGVPADLFGRRKAAASFDILGAERLITEATRRDLDRYLAERETALDRLHEGAFSALHHGLELTSGNLTGPFGRVFRRIGFLRRRARRLNRRFEYSRWGGDYRPRSNRVLMWALERTGERYAAACALLRPPSRTDPG